MDNSYVTIVKDSYRITGTRVSLDSVIYDYLSGISPESIAGIDFMTANEAGLAGIDDTAVLALAASHSRLLVSHDVSTMPEAFSRLIQEKTSPGMILISQELSYREAIEGLLRVWSTTQAEDWQNVLSLPASITEGSLARRTTDRSHTLRYPPVFQ